MQKYLLPAGFYDLLGDEAKSNQATIDILLHSFYTQNYQLIKTPLVECEESFKKFSKQIDEQSFRMVDSFSGKAILIRSDITPQIARLMATRLQNIQMPIRLCYVGDVLKIRNDNLYADRQLTQVGIELIGDDSCSSNSEIIELTISSLKKIKLSNLIINFCLPQLLDHLLISLDVQNQNNLKKAIISKNISEISNLAGKYCNNLINLTLENQDFDKINLALSNLPIDAKTNDKILKWQKTISDIKSNHQEISFSLDIFGDEEFSYHNQIGFNIFADGCSYPIARGGRYFINDFTPAIGSTIYINNLRKILK